MQHNKIAGLDIGNPIPSNIPSRSHSRVGRQDSVSDNVGVVDGNPGPSRQTDESDALEGEGILPFHPGLSSIGQDAQSLLAHQRHIGENRRRHMTSYMNGVAHNLAEMACSMEQQCEMLDEMASWLTEIGQQHTMMLDLLTELEEEFESCL